MPIETIEFKGEVYPALQSRGNAMKFAIPFFKEFIKEGDKILDIGCNRLDWAYPGAMMIDPEVNGTYDAYSIPAYDWDAIVSSHCLEHLPDWVAALDYWATKLKHGGFLGLYLPDMSIQRYWRPQNNRKHLHYLVPDIIGNYFDDRAHLWCKVFIAGCDLNASFYAIAERL